MRGNTIWPDKSSWTSRISLYLRLTFNNSRLQDVLRKWRTIMAYQNIQVVWSLNESEIAWILSVPSMRNRSKDGLHGRCTPHGLSNFDVDASCILYVRWRLPVAAPTMLERCSLCPRNRCKIWRTAFAPYSLPSALAQALSLQPVSWAKQPRFDFTCQVKTRHTTFCHVVMSPSDKVGIQLCT